jgi:CheY-like chemotaxis protein
MDQTQQSAPFSILIAEDEVPLAQAMNTILQQAGYTTTVVSNGNQVLDILQKQTFDLIILDILMPQKNGLEVLEEIVRRNIDIPVVIASNLSREDEITEAKRLGAVEYFIKSETALHSLIEIVERVRAR